jgi:hypothetical protein
LASVGSPLTFRAELMPGKNKTERTYAVERLLQTGRVELAGLTGQHAEAEFETTAVPPDERRRARQERD